MNENEDIENTNDNRFNTKLVITVVVVLIYSAIVAGFYLWNFYSHPLSTSPERWGQLGDYIGGLMNPAIGIATIFLIILSINTQRRELRASIKEMKHANEATKKMSFEQSFFTWLENYHSQIRDININNDTGRKALHHLYCDHLTVAHASGYLSSADNGTASYWIQLHLSEGEKGRPRIIEILKKSIMNYGEVYRKNQSDFDSAFRTLYRLIRWIDKSANSNETKWHYCSILRSQLSGPELIFIYYNGLINENNKMAQYANKYALFDNITESDKLIEFSVSKFTEILEDAESEIMQIDAPWPYKQSAFSSDTAKLNLCIPLSL